MSPTYEVCEVSVHDGAPIEGYEFTLPDEVFRYTNAERSYVINGSTFYPLNITRTEIPSVFLGGDTAEVMLRLPMNASFAQEVLGKVVPSILQLRIYRAHRHGNPALEYNTLWQGEIAGLSVEGSSLEVRSLALMDTVLNTDLPNMYYQQLCNHRLYDPMCGVSKAANANISTIVDINEEFIKLNASYPTDYLKRGSALLTYRNEQRTIVYNSADLIKVSYPFHVIQVGDSITTYRGCDRTYATCAGNFLNTDNFGGFTYVPLNNPFKDRL